MSSYLNLNSKLFAIWKNIDDRFGSGLDDTMKTKPLVVFSCFALLSVAFVGTASAADTKIEQALRDLDVQWAKAVEAKDLDKSVSYFESSQDAKLIRSGRHVPEALLLVRVGLDGRSCGREPRDRAAEPAREHDRRDGPEKQDHRCHAGRLQDLQSKRVLEDASEGFTLDVIREDEAGNDETISIDKLSAATGDMCSERGT